MTLTEQIQHDLELLPLEKQLEVLDFVAFLRHRGGTEPKARPGTLSQHPAFGSWQARKIDALAYQEDLRSEWDAT